MLLVQLIKALIPDRLQPRAVAQRSMERLRKTGLVAAGPFAGMVCPERSIGSAHWPKRLGVYEAELTPVIERLQADETRLVINVGAAEGYYALGCARRWPQSRVIAFEQEQEGRELLKAFAVRNGVSERIEVRGVCSAGELKRTLDDAGQGLLIMDVEGGEDELLAGPNVGALRTFHILVELHDLRRERLGERLRARFEASHVIEEIHTRPRRYADFSFPRNPLLRLYLLRQLQDLSDELRGAPMRWYMMTPRVPSPTP